jgi:hypothetical protein
LIFVCNTDKSLIFSASGYPAFIRPLIEEIVLSPTCAFSVFVED